MTRDFRQARAARVTVTGTVTAGDCDGVPNAWAGATGMTAVMPAGGPARGPASHWVPVPASVSSAAAARTAGATDSDSESRAAAPPASHCQCLGLVTRTVAAAALLRLSCRGWWSRAGFTGLRHCDSAAVKFNELPA